MNAHRLAAFGGNTQPAWPFFKASVAAIPALPVIHPLPVAMVIATAATKTAPTPYAALHAVFRGDKDVFDAFITRTVARFADLNPDDLTVKSVKAFMAAPPRVQVNVFAGDKACRIAALRKSLPDAVKKVFYGKGSKGFRTFISLFGADELEAVAVSMVPSK